MRASVLRPWQLAASVALATVGCGVGAGRTMPSDIGRSDAPAPTATAAARRAGPARAATAEPSPQSGLALPSWARRRPPAPDAQDATEADSADGEATELEGQGEPSGDHEELGEPEQ